MARKGEQFAGLTVAIVTPFKDGKVDEVALKRMVDWSDAIGKTIHLVYYPPYHSKYNPVERCWGVLEMHWNGALLNTCETMLRWAATMTWKGIHPVVSLCEKVYEKGISLSKRAMKSVEARLQRNPALPKWDITINSIAV